MTKTIEGAAALPNAATVAPVADLDAIKARQRTTWASGDFGIIGTTLQIVGESLCEAVNVRSGSKVLDVAAGNGNSSLAAARRWCEVTSTDYVPALLDDGRRRAEAERLPITFQEADVEALPFTDGTFDVVLSSFGVMFAPNHEKSASEMLRVCRSNGRIGLANWTPRGFIGRLFAVVGRYVPPPAGLTPPARWGTEEHLEHLFRASASDIKTTPRDFFFRYRSPQHWVDVFRSWYGPVHKAFAGLPAEKQPQLEKDLIDLIAEFNTSGDSTMIVPGEYLEVVVVKA
jgi:ubiquinone/menaquinone biosynthesis C-methylase UbiE